MRLLIKKQIYMVGGCMQDRKPNWIMIGIIILNTFIWWSIFTYGLFVTTMWVIVVAAIIGLYFRMSGKI